MATRWPAARFIGVDSDAAMLARARERTAGDGRFAWIEADIGEWQPKRAPDVVFSNAALHWLDDHARLFVRLLESLLPGGALAVQMPDNFSAPSHQELVALAGHARFGAPLQALVRGSPVARADDYVAWLSPRARTIDVWTTEYMQILAARNDGEHPIVAWMQGAALTPYLSALAADAAERFLSEYRARILARYPARPDGSVVFPFRRLFIVAIR
jgi:trans-aconitate 2-methyltransferase